MTGWGPRWVFPMRIGEINIKVELTEEAIKETKSMGYIQDMERELKALLEGLPDEDKKKNIIKYMKEKVLESYRNGLEERNKERKGGPTLDRFSK